MKPHLHQYDLPVAEIAEDVNLSLQQNNTLIIQAPPGAGKSTLLPLLLLDQPWLNQGKIIMLEPRRLAAKSVASRMASMINEELGQTIGYRIRFESKTSADTKIEVVTEGILTRMLQSDNALEGVGMVIFDEFHERSIHADLALALCRESQGILREDLRLLVMSATLDLSTLGKLLQCPTINSAGRQHPVEIKHEEDIDIFALPQAVTNTAQHVLQHHTGDILVFLPGEGEIKKCEEALLQKTSGARITPLYGMLPWSKQQQALLPDKSGGRRIVLATAIAETSLTIEGISVVIDSGFGRKAVFDPHSGLSKLETIRISRDSANQRSGRAGRLGPGTGYRLWSKATDHRLEEHRTPEIAESDLASLVLDLAQWNIKDYNQLTWLTPPPKGHFQQAQDLLEEIDALENGSITEHGRRVHELPCHPRIAHMLIKAHELNQVALAADLAAIIEDRDPLGREAGIDINLRIEALRRKRRDKTSAPKWSRLAKTAAQYRKLFDIPENNQSIDPYATGLLISYAYPERIAHAKPGNNAQFKLANGQIASFQHGDDLAHEPWLAVANVQARQNMGKIFLASQLDPKDLKSLVKEQDVVVWDWKADEIRTTRDLRIGSIVLKSVPLSNPDPELVIKEICKALRKDGEQLLDFNKEVKSWQARVESLRKWNKNEDWPEVNTSALLASCHEWITPYLDETTTSKDLKKLNLVDILNHSLDFDLQQSLAKLAPQKIEVPSGSNIKLDYQEDGGPPVLAARLQEVFGLESIPKVNNEQQTVLMHLLSPGYKPVQVTSDLTSFWDNTYFEVRKELKRRYPKHSWPDDPRTSEAMRGVKRRK